MTIPIKKLLSITDNRYEFTVAAMKLIDKVGGATIDGVDYESWKIVPRVLNSLLEDEFKVLSLKEVAELKSAQQILNEDAVSAEVSTQANSENFSESTPVEQPESTFTSSLEESADSK